MAPAKTNRLRRFLTRFDSKIAGIINRAQHKTTDIAAASIGVIVLGAIILKFGLPLIGILTAGLGFYTLIRVVMLHD